MNKRHGHLTLCQLNVGCYEQLSETQSISHYFVLKYGIYSNYYSKLLCIYYLFFLRLKQHNKLVLLLEKNGISSIFSSNILIFLYFLVFWTHMKHIVKTITAITTAANENAKIIVWSTFFSVTVTIFTSTVTYLPKRTLSV